MSVKIKFLGHATFLITTPGGRKLLIDPWVMNNPACPDEDKELGSLDTLLITHGHADHFQDAIEIAKKYKPAIGCIYEIGHYLGEKGIENCQPMSKGGGQKINDVHVVMTDARHSSSLIEEGGKIWDGGEPAGFVVTFEDGQSIYHAGDTGIFYGMQLIAELYQPDLVMLPVGDLFTMGPKEAAHACKLLKAKRVIPMHYGTFPPLTGTPEEFAKLVSDQDVEVITMEAGNSYNM
ncbi:MAG TPA: metal-dependent hydrolase [Acidobacteriota bacterium]|nr:metal-dependent hydrolase [Acidobacteriota bacterium]